VAFSGSSRKGTPSFSTKILSPRFAIV
jgi:hypothetical protein